MSDNIQTNTTGRLTPCLQRKIDKTRYLVEIHFKKPKTRDRPPAPHYSEPKKPKTKRQAPWKCV